ncbi:MAG: galactose mutarotase [Streptococcaceae bacterium]|jgi:aldose 1-epimerase|nr:galactose mutarotase [Streptococcaceae bacterium]
MKITKKDFGLGYTLIEIENDNGVKLRVSDLGARIVGLLIPGEKTRDLVVGFDNAQEYIQKDLYVGATIGRTAGRLIGGNFKINETIYQADVNEHTGNTLHGANGFISDKWTFSIKNNEVVFTHTSPDGEYGYPGNLSVEVKYTLNNDNIWSVEYQAKTDKDTLFNPTNHVYFNLTGNVENTINEHMLMIDADEFLPLSQHSTPIGIKEKVKETVFDFRQPKRLSEVFASDFPQKKLVDGIDHPFLLNKTKNKLDAALFLPKENISIEVTTSEPAVIIYTANGWPDGLDVRGQSSVKHSSITFETQVAPGAVEFPELKLGTIILKANETYTSKTDYKIKF